MNLNLNLNFFALDIVILTVIALSMLLGMWRGLVFEVLSLASWIAAFFLAQWFAPTAAAMLPIAQAGESLRYAAGFAVVFIGVVFLGGLVAWLVKKMIQSVGLRPIDRILGAIFGLARGVLLMLALSVVVNLSPIKDTSSWKESKAAAWSTIALQKLKPILPRQFGQYLPV